jgi:hypothetical protein
MRFSFPSGGCRPLQYSIKRFASPEEMKVKSGSNGPLTVSFAKTSPEAEKLRGTIQMIPSKKPAVFFI